ncbi:MAG: sulfatase-like hydrolase/transferase [Pararhodobacter sp.]|nr:sulfatase-like hydrolase/transferase [Pararhodobacter sp.]
MPSTPRNLIVVLSDEHDPRFMGASGHPAMRTPNLDRLAARGRRFANAYTPSPICVPARASMATGLYVHQTGCWDNATAYDGSIPGWGHALQNASVRVESIGKLHYRRTEDPTGFDRQHLPMHLAGGTGQIWGSVRDPLPRIAHAERPRMLGERIGIGETDYTRFDRAVTSQAVQWLEKAAHTPGAEPWVLFVGLAAPHFPLVAPAEFAALYPPENTPTPKLRPQAGYRRHPWVQDMHDYWPHDDGFAGDEERMTAIRMYMALCSFLDHNLGQIMETMAETGLDRDTRIIYTSDHGDNLGARGMWGKSTLYQESVAVPMILAGPDIEPGVERAPVSLVDMFPTILDAVGLDPEGVPPAQRPGLSLLSASPLPADRAVLSEYHAVGAPSGAFMLRKGRWKLHYYVGYSPELFDIEADPEELNDRTADPECAEILDDLVRALFEICDPKAVDARAKADQAALVNRFGGRDKAVNQGVSGATPAPRLAVERANKA